jgi:hypothetical protein
VEEARHNLRTRKFLVLIPLLRASVVMPVSSFYLSLLTYTETRFVQISRLLLKASSTAIVP